MADVKGTYPNSAEGNFSVVDTIGVPHPYCITPKHIEHSPGVYLDVAEAEKHGAQCDICRQAVKHGKQAHVLTHDEHKTALLVACKVTIDPAPDELRQWLLSIKDETEANGYEGWAFSDKM